jgi:hypothetical protein
MRQETVESFRRYFTVDADGILRRRKSGRAVGTISDKGYLRTRIAGRFVPVHRIVFAIHNGRLIADGMEVDHINRARTDNRPENLREVTRQQNRWNATPRQPNSAGARGVYAHKGAFHARIMVDRKLLHLGRFKTTEEAHAAFLAAELLYRGVNLPSPEDFASIEGLPNFDCPVRDPAVSAERVVA